MNASGRLPADEVERLFGEFATHRRRRTRNRLVEAHTGFANHVARRFANRGAAEDDLRQVALLALVKAVDRFDPDNGAAFTTFAGRTIEGELKRYFRDATWAVRVPRSAKERHLLVRNGTEELRQQNGRAPTPRELAAHLDISVDEVVEALGVSAAYSSATLDPPSDDDGPGRFHGLGADDRALESTPDRLLVERLLGTLPEREAEIVRLRFYEELTQTEIAERVGVSQMHVSRLLRRALEAMRDQPSAG